MRVFIDARSLSHPRRGGFKTYVEGLVSALSALEDCVEYDLIYDRPFHAAVADGDPRFHESVVLSGVPLVGQVLREQLGLPIYARSQQAGLWHFPYNTAPALAKSPYVLTLHDMTVFTHPLLPDWSRPGRALKDIGMHTYPRMLISRSAHRARAIITVSEYARGRIVDLLAVDPDKVHVTPLAASPIFAQLSSDERVSARQTVEQKFGLSRPFVLSIASTLLKNPIGVLAVYARLPIWLRREYDLVLVMAHEQVRAVVERRIVDLGVMGQVRVLTNVAPEHLLLLYNSAELLLYPSLTESFPLPTVEAMSCGLPVICSDTTGFPEQVGDAAIKLPPNATDSLAAATAEVLTDRQFANELSARGLERSRLFTWHRTASETLAIYKLVAGAD